jgi:hypothetical protein
MALRKIRYREAPMHSLTALDVELETSVWISSEVLELEFDDLAVLFQG